MFLEPANTLVQIQPLLPEHWEAVKMIYERGIETGNATFQTSSPATWAHWDRGHLQHSRFVAIAGDKIVGWIALSPISTRECYKGVSELSVYVDTEHGSRGIGKLLMKEVVANSEANGIWSLYSSTFPENGASIALQKRFGFREIGYRERIAQLKGVWRDTILLERRSKIAGR